MQYRIPCPTRTVTAYRMHVPKWATAPTSGAGAAAFGGRVNRPGTPALYLALEPATAIGEYQQPVLLRFKDAPHENRGEVNALLDEHIGHVEQRIRELRALEKDLKELRRQCAEAQPARDCGILNELTHAAQHVAQPTRQEHSHIRGSHKRAIG